MQLKSRVIALPLAAVLASGAFFSSAPAQAAPKSKIYKGGAIALGVLGGYLLSKGKTLEGAAALGGGYLAYKKGEKERKDEKYDDRYDNGRYNNGRYDNGRYDNGRYDHGRSDNGRYDNWNTGWDNDNNNDYRYNNSSYDGNGYDPDCRDNGPSRSNGRSWQR